MAAGHVCQETVALARAPFPAFQAERADGYVPLIQAFPELVRPPDDGEAQSADPSDVGPVAALGRHTKRSRRAHTPMRPAGAELQRREEAKKPRYTKEVATGRRKAPASAFKKAYPVGPLPGREPLGPAVLSLWSL